MTAPADRPLWACPRCGNTFVSRNPYHSCGRHRLSEHFQGRLPIVRRTFDAWLAAARACGRVRVTAQKTRIVFQDRVRFAGAVIRAHHVNAHLWLLRRAAHPRLSGTEVLGRCSYVHRFGLERPEDVDQALRGLMREAYAVGRQEHLRRRP